MELDFGECKLEEVPESICCLTNLRILRLDNNKLKKLPQCILQLDLIELTTEGNTGLDHAHINTLLVRDTHHCLFSLGTYACPQQTVLIKTSIFHFLGGANEVENNA